MRDLNIPGIMQVLDHEGLIQTKLLSHESNLHPYATKNSIIRDLMSTF